MVGFPASTQSAGGNEGPVVRLHCGTPEVQLQQGECMADSRMAGKSGGVHPLEDLGQRDDSGTNKCLVGPLSGSGSVSWAPRNNLPNNCGYHTRRRENSFTDGNQGKLAGESVRLGIGKKVTNLGAVEAPADPLRRRSACERQARPWCMGSSLGKMGIIGEGLALALASGGGV
jgi:hypothetical protein